VQARTIAPSPAASRRVRVALAIVCALGIAIASAIVAQSIARNPLARVPVNDAQVYWQWAGEIASGKLVGTTPYLSAPLYPYVVAAVRVLGGGLGAVYALQVVLHAATALLLYRIGASRFSRTSGLVAAALYFLLADPAYYTARVLNCTLQAFVVAALWERALVLIVLPRPRTALVVGLLVGVNVLANPTMLVSIPIFAAWTWWLAGRGSNGTKLAAIVAAASLATVAPATMHNWLACGELIPVSAQAGVTFYHGNAPGADGTYHPIAGISSDRIRQNLDARDMVKAETDGTWKATSKAFFDKGLAYWRAEPGRALALAARKIYWFVAGRNYGDIYVPELEIEDGSASLVRLAPVPVAWWTIPTLALLVLSFRELRRNAPEIVLFVLPLATVALFWYSPRYRFPAIPVMCVLGAELLVELASTTVSLRRKLALAAALALGIALGFVNRANGFDRADDYRGQYEQVLGSVLVQQGRFEEAEAHFRRALELGRPDARASLGDVLRRLHRDDEALELLREGARAPSADAYAHRSLAVALAGRHDFAAARAEFEAALKLDPNDWESLSGLGNVFVQSGRPQDAIAQYEAALRLYPAFATARFNLGCALADLHRTADAETAFRAVLKTDPAFVPACTKLVEILVARVDHAAAIALLRRTLQHTNRDPSLENELAWELATAPETPQRNGGEALAIAQRLVRLTNEEDAGPLDTLAAALAECGRFDEAERTAARCVEIARSSGAPEEVVRALESRRELYRSKRPYRQPAL
jgi:tetratricopeptide (TPR) repeat protein